ncbi:low-density lipoprotein receptor-related protein 6 [Lepeophtheirus salmonis]|nr:low-density lipoprotein receptor-related protein 6-like [Lepeophtheirus salmonis]
MLLLLRIILLVFCCVSQGVRGRPYILFANKKDIRLVEVPPDESQGPPKTTIVVKHLEDATAFDFFLEDGIVCWTEIAPKVIRCSEIDPRKKGRVKKNTIVNTGLLKPEGLACDWIGKKIYWTDSETKRIEVSSLVLNSSERKVLVWEDLDLPRAIVLSPKDGLMFWSDWGTYPKIERAGMDGSDRRLLVDQNLGWPNGITLDYENRLLYWIEAKWHYIASVDWEGKDQKNYYSDKNDLPQPFAISFKGNALYWTDWTTNSLHTMNISTWYENSKTIDRIKLRGKLTPMDIKVFEPSRQKVPEIPSHCSIDNGGCSHLCLSSPISYSCSCPTGLQMVDESNCAEEFKNVLLMARRDDLRKISLDTPDLTDLVIPLQFDDNNSSSKHEMNSIAIDYDPVLGDVYWTDQFLGIHRAKLDGSEVTDVIIDEVDHPDGLAVDWLTRNVYWSDTGTDRIEVARLNDGKIRRVVVSGDLDEPRGIALDPMRGWMYWSDWGKPAKIEKAWMDGRHREILVSEGIVWPNGVTIDIEAQKLYWCDAKTDKIEVINVDGTGRRVIVSEILPHPFGLTVLGDYVYWTDWREKTLERAHKDSGEEREILINHLKGLMGLKASTTHPNSDWNNGCSLNNGGCSHLCLFTPSGRVCACPNDHELTSKGNTCEIPDAYLLYTRKDNIGRVSIRNPEHNGFTLPLKDVRHASALDYDNGEARIYWTDIEDKAISRSYLNGSHQEAIIEFGLDFPDGLAFDWISRNIYWTDMGLHRIEVFSSKTSKRKCLIWKNLHSPSSLVLDPVNGDMYWSSWGEKPFIEKSALDGSSRSIFLNDVGRSYGLTIDFTASLLYWSDLDGSSIAFVSLVENSDKTITRLLSDTIKQPYGLTLYKDTIYWSDWDKSTIEKANKNDGSERIILQNKLDEVMDILVIQDQNKIGTNPCAVSNGNCSDLCLFVLGKVTCQCPSHYETRGGNNKCLPPNSFILYSQKNKVSRLLLDDEHHVPDVTLPIKGLRNIKSATFDPIDRMLYWIDLGGNRRNKDEDRIVTIRRAHDLNGTLIDKHWLSLKEKDFLPFDIAVDYINRILVWSCEKTNAINVTKLDDGEKWSGGLILSSSMGDKPRCIEIHSKKGLIFWTNVDAPLRIERCSIDGQNRKILVDTSLSSISDIEVDEADNLLFWVDVDTFRIESSDLEGNRRQVLVNLEKSRNKNEPVFIAVDDLYLVWGIRDALSLYIADKRTGLHQRILKSNIKHMSALISVNVVKKLNHPCFSSDCSNLCLPSGACSCSPGLVLNPDGRTCGSPPTCQPDQFTCNSGTPSCIPFQWRCDGQPECSDHSDEMDCPECGVNQFRCQNGQCINGTNLCDKINHCSDNSDELNCCLGNQFQCVLSKECIPRNMTCNSFSDCSDGSDEMLPQCNVVGSEGNDDSSMDSNMMLTKPSVPSNTSTYLIVIFVGLMSILVFGLSVYYCKRKSLAVENEVDSRDPLAISASNPMLNKNNPPILDQRSIITNDPILKLPINTGIMYDRSHVTGASSSSSRNGSVLPNNSYAGPHPSPATSVISHNVIRRPHPHFSSNRTPPPTPCSTDINEEESEYYSHIPIRPHFPSAANSVYDSETYGPTKPRQLLSTEESSPPRDSSCPPSPNTERSFFIDKSLLPPGGPPPSPVPSIDDETLNNHIINP